MRIGPVAFRVDLRVASMVGVALALLIALAAWSLTLGSFQLSIGEVLAALSGRAQGSAGFVVLDLRLPRTLAAVLVGVSLAVSGAIFQGLVRNPLVSPDIIGIDAGAALAAVYWIVAQRSEALIPAVALLGAFGAAAGVYLLSWKGRIAPGRLVLVGIAMNALLAAATTTLLVVRARINDASEAVRWMTGSVYATSWGDVRLLGLGALLLLPTAVALMSSLRVLQVGDLTARSVGLPVERVRLALLVVGCALSAMAVAVAGPIGFVALVAPHVARILGGAMAGGVLLLTGLLGALMLLGSDMVVQHLVPVSLPVGVLTAAVGAPYFLYLLYRTNVRL